MAGETHEVHRFGEGPPTMLVEVPHGADRRHHYDTLAEQLEGPLPADLHVFFHVNTDVGAAPLALDIAARLAELGHSVAVIRCLLPRTLVDTNRTLAPKGDGMTAGIPSYITDASDRSLLASLHERYVGVVDEMMAGVMERGGIALLLHSYAPRTVGIEVVDEHIVQRLREVYQPEVFETWPLRAEVDFISRDAEGKQLSIDGAADSLKEGFATIGLTMKEDDTYYLHAATQGGRYAALYPGRTLSLELRRDLIMKTWNPFEEMDADPAAIGPIAQVIAGVMASQDSAATANHP